MHFVLPHIATAAFWLALWKIMIANVILSGDNAVVIAMAARNLTEKHRKAAIIFGGAGAIVLLIIFCGLLGYLLDVPYLKLVGGALLLWIGIKLVGDEEEGGDVKAHEQLWPAIWSIALQWPTLYAQLAVGLVPLGSSLSIARPRGCSGKIRRL